MFSNADTGAARWREHTSSAVGYGYSDKSASGDLRSIESREECGAGMLPRCVAVMVMVVGSSEADGGRRKKTLTTPM